MKPRAWNVMKTLGSLPLILALATSLCAHAPLNAQTQAHHRQQSSHDLSLLSLAAVQRRAEAGDVRAEVELGERNLHGTGGVSLDYAEALVWFRKAAAQGNADAENNLGGIYQNGQGVLKDYSQALVWYQKAAAQGNADAEDDLGFVYLIGQGVAKDYSQALAWYQKAAAQGDANAETNLGMMYLKGDGVVKDYSQALAWFQKAAAQGDPVAENNLGAMYQDGQGVQQDYSQALAWFQKAAAQGDAGAEQNLADLRQQIANQHQASSQAEPEGSNSGGDCNSVLKANMQNNCHIPNNGSACDMARAMETCYQDAATAGASVCPESVISQMKQEAKGAAQTANSVCDGGAH